MRMAAPLEQLFSYPIDDIAAALPAGDDPVWDIFPRHQKTFKVHQATRSIVFKFCNR